MGALLPPIPAPVVVCDRAGLAWTSSLDLAAFARTQHGNVLQKAQELEDADPPFFAAHFQRATYVSHRSKREKAVWMDLVGVAALRFRFPAQKTAQVEVIEAMKQVEAAARVAAASAPEPEPQPVKPEPLELPQPEPEVQALSGGRMLEFLFEHSDDFETQAFELRIIDRDENPWWIVGDICAALDIGNPSDAAARLDADEKGIVQIDTLGGRQAVLACNEPGMWKLVLRSDKPRAKGLIRFLTHEVLPQIRRTGKYDPNPQPENVVRLDDLRRLPSGIKALLIGLEEDKEAAERRAVAAEHEAAALAQEKAEIAQYSAELAAKFDQAAQFVAAFQRLVNAEGLVLVSDIAKVLHIPKDDMFKRLHAAGFIYKRAPRKPWLARDRYVREGLFDHKFWTQTLNDGTKVDRPQLYATRKGVERIAMLFGTDDDGGQGRFAFGMH